jgi:uncharacterized C2H2 Zn-finger protein
MTTPKYSNYKCTHCDTIFTRKYNLERHMLRKHLELVNTPEQQNGSNLQQNGSNLQQNGSNLQQNSSNLQHFSGNSKSITEDVTIHNENEYKCTLCDKTFNKKWILTRHEKVCKGKHETVLSCQYCHKHFSHKKSIYKHSKICMEKHQALTVKDSNLPKSGIHINNNSHNANIIGQQTNTTIKTQNNQNIIIVYNPDNMEFVKDKMDNATFKKIIEKAQHAIDTQFIAEYSKGIFSIKENQCIRKEDLKANYSHVHIGDDKWELKLDKHVYPKLASNIANDMSNYLHTKKDHVRKELFGQLIRFLDYMADSGYINTDDVDEEKRIYDYYQDIIKELRLILYSKSKEI